MNLINSSGDELLYLNFNQDSSCISVGTRRGYRIYTVNPLSKAFSAEEGGIGVVEMLFSTSLVALVGAGEQPAFSPRRLQICNTKSRNVICELNFNSTVLAVRMNKERLIVVVENKIHIYDLRNLKILYSIDTEPNPKGICALSPDATNGYLTYASSSNTGEIAVFDTVSLQVVNIVSCHKSPVESVVFNAEGTMIATASEKGTVIRVFSIPGGVKQVTFRRGSSQTCVHSMAFSRDSKYLCVSSDTGTIHVFMIANDGGVEVGSNPGSWPSASKFLPEVLTDVVDSVRGVAQVKLPENSTGMPSLCSFDGASHTQLLVLTANGLIHRFKVEKDGVCELASTQSLLEKGGEVGVTRV